MLFQIIHQFTKTSNGVAVSTMVLSNLNNTNTAPRLSVSGGSAGRGFKFVPEDEEFLALFPYRNDYLWAVHPAPGAAAQWQTENRHPLSDRLIQQGAYLYGVRFGSHSNYLMLDVDRESRYHPARDRHAIARMIASLEPLGIVQAIPLSSSYSGGLHLYFPFSQGLPSWALAQAAQCLLENGGFTVEKGQLEIFPNSRMSSGSAFNGHRLPLQLGSYLLNSDFQPCYSSREAFCLQWRFAVGQNSEVDQSKLARVMKFAERRSYRKVRGSAQKFLNDLSAEIEAGWTGPGQTNYILGRIAMRERIFYHALHGGEPLMGYDLIERIVDVAEGLPGYYQYCRHISEIDTLALYWARSAEDKYYPYGYNPLQPPDEPQGESWNLKQAISAAERIRLAVAALLEAGELPETARDRANAIAKSAGVSLTSLYKNRDIWHPKTLQPKPAALLHPVEPIEEDPRSLQPKPAALLHPVGTISFGAFSAIAPQEQIAEQATDDPGGSGGGCTAPAHIRDLVRRSVMAAKEKNRQKIASRLGESPPPDEQFFKQLKLIRSHDP